MRYAFTVLGLFLSVTTACAAMYTSTSSDVRWCFSERPSEGTSFVDLKDYKVYPVDKRLYSSAVERLSDITVQPISLTEAISFADDQELVEGAHYYLARAGGWTYTPADKDRTVEDASDAKFEVLWEKGTKEAAIVSMQIVNGEVFPANIPVVLVSPVEIYHVYVGCFSMS